jgi:hypothetical protein
MLRSFTKLRPSLRKFFASSQHKCFSNNNLEKGEFIDYGTPAATYLSEEVASFDFARRKISYDTEEIYTLKVNKETLLTAEDNIKSNLNKFDSLFDMEEEKVS